MKTKKMPAYGWSTEGRKTKIKNKIKKMLAVVLALLFSGGAVGMTYAATTPTLNQTINAGAKSVDIVDAGGASVGSPSATFGALSFSFNTQDATASNVFTSSQKIRVSNPTSTATWTVNIAGSATTAKWTAGTNYYDFNDGSGYTDGADADSYGGQLTVDPSGGTIAGVSGCATTNVTAGASDSFVEGTTDSIDLLNGGASASTFCRWDFTGVNLTQKVPAGQASGSYSVSLSITII